MNEIEQVKVSIAIPVFNGENYLAQTIDSILGQTYDNIELIICDNASTDRTGAISQHCANTDRRVRYVRNSRNIGLSANFNRAFELSTRKYFKWAAHDDLLAPTFIEKCVAALEREPDAVLAQPLVRMIDSHGRIVPFTEYDAYHLLKINELPLSSLPRPSDRFEALIRQPRPCWAPFGLIRREALAKTALIAPYLWSDVTFGAELALLGRFAIIPEELFFNRDHPARFTTTTILDRETSWRWWCMRDGPPGLLDLCPNWQIQWNLRRIVRKHVTDRRERYRSYVFLLRHVISPYVLSRLAFEPLAALDPRIHATGRRVRAALRRSVQN